MIGSNLQSVLPLKDLPTRLDLNPYGWYQSPYSLWWYRSTPTADDSFSERESLAVDAGGHMCSIIDDTENNWLTQVIDEQQGEFAQTQIGFYSPGVDGNYEWIDGSSVDFTNWASTEPTGAPASIGNLALASGVLAASGWVKNPDNGRWYTAIDQQMAWDEANALAASYGCQLPVLSSASLNSWFTANVVDPLAQQCWIGMRYNGVSYEWVDGTIVDYTNWASGEPDDEYGVRISVTTGLWRNSPITHNTIRLSLELVNPTLLTEAQWTLIANRIPGEWSDDVDDNITGVMQIKDTSALTTSQFNVIRMLGLGWIRSNDTGFWYRLDDEQESWSAHETLASGIGAQLASITSDALNTWAVDYLETPTTGVAWLGLQKGVIDWEWTNGDTFLYENWDNLQPSGNIGQTVGLLGFTTDAATTQYKWKSSGDAQNTDSWVNVGDANVGFLDTQGWIDNGLSYYDVVDGYYVIVGQAFGRWDGSGYAPQPTRDMVEFYGLEDATFQLRWDVEADGPYATSDPTAGPRFDVEFRDDNDVVVDSFTTYLETDIGDLPGGPAFVGELDIVSAEFDVPVDGRRMKLLLGGSWPAEPGSPSLSDKWHMNNLSVNIKQGAPHEAVYEVRDPDAITELQWRAMIARYGLQGL